MAVNRMLGESELVVGEKAYGLVFDPNAFCYAEEALGMDTDAIIGAVQDGARSMRVVRALIWGALQKKHPQLHLIAVGELIAAVGLPAARTAMMKGLVAALGAPKEAEGEESPDPPEATASAGTG